jgi:hypothetical protein
MPDDPQEGQTTGATPVSGGDPVDDTLAALGLTPEHVRNTPEYRELARQNRILARQAGDAAAQAAKAREAAEAAAQAAEAERMTAQETRIRDILGDEGVAMWDQFADLSNTDPVAAAELLAQFTAARAQSPSGGATPEAEAGGGTQVPTNTTPTTGLSRAVSGDTPLGGVQDDTTQLIEQLEKRYTDTVDRNLTPATRNRVTAKERAAAMIAFLGAAYLKSGARPRS